MQAAYESGTDLANAPTRSTHGRQEPGLGHPAPLPPESRAPYTVEERAGREGHAIR